MTSPSAIVKLLAPRVPGMLKTTLWQTLGLSETSDKWDLRTALIVTTLRDIIVSSTSSITKQQSFGLRDPGVKGPMWISRVKLPVPDEDDVRQLLFKTIDALNSDNGTYTKCETNASLTAEWTGHRSAAGKEMPEASDLSEETKYRALMDEVKSDVTVLYFHGGAYYLMDPASHRPTTAKLARKTKGRVLSVRYRLAPQHPFPSALLDALDAYLYLLYPPPGSFHTPVKPEHIVFAGDSAGGNLAISLLLLLTHLHHSPSPTVQYNGKQVDVPLPGGCATNSPWTDLTRSMPSMTRNAKYDYLPDPRVPSATAPPSKAAASANSSVVATGRKKKPPPPCDAWPANPARADLFCDGGMLCHPLVSPLASTAEMWRGCPPLFVCMGEEMLSDEGRLVVRRAAQAGVKVVWEGFEGMPHCFAMVLEGDPSGRRCFKGWSESVRQFVESPQEVQSRGIWVKALERGEESVDIQGKDFVTTTDDECWGIMQGEMRRRCAEFETELKQQRQGKL